MEKDKLEPLPPTDHILLVERDGDEIHLRLSIEWWLVALTVIAFVVAVFWPL